MNDIFKTPKISFQYQNYKSSQALCNQTLPHKMGQTFLKEGDYFVEDIVGIQIKSGRKMYLVKWLGYPESENTWEPIEHLAGALSKVEDYEAMYVQNQPFIEIEEEIEEAGETYGTRIFKKQGQNIELDNDESDPEPRLKKRRKRTCIIDEEGSLEVGSSSFDQSVEEPEPSNNVTEEEVQEITKESVYIAQLRESRISAGKPVVDVESEQVEVYESTSGENGAYMGNRKKNRRSGSSNRGSFEANDIPKEILEVRLEDNKQLSFKVEWERRRDGGKPGNSYVSKEDLKLYHPRILLEYYETRIHIISNEEERKFLKGKKL